jgi:hypothetical protein
MSGAVIIGLQLDVSAVVVSVTMAMLANRFDSMGNRWLRYVHQIQLISLCHKRQCVLQLQRSACTFGYAQGKGLKHGVGRANPYNAGL